MYFVHHCSKDCSQWDHRTGGSPRSARKGGGGDKGQSSILVTKMWCTKDQETEFFFATLLQLCYFRSQHFTHFLITEQNNLLQQRQTFLIECFSLDMHSDNRAIKHHTEHWKPCPLRMAKAHPRGHMTDR